MKLISVNEQMDLIKRGVVEILPESELVKKLENSHSEGKPLKVKLGCDPSRADLHIGHAVVLRKLRHFQDLGHQAILVIGDFTAMIGDPSGRNKTRPQLTLEETRNNAESYVEQASIILDPEKLKIVYNSDWLNKMNFSDVIQLCSRYTVARMLERDDFTKRFQSEIPISMHEILYPLAQGMDSVHLKADVELGGTDQKFNLLVGRTLQKEYGQDPQIVLTLPLLEGTDGIEKMSKSYDNHIGLHASPNDMYGRTLSIPDTLIEKYFLLAADANADTLESVKMKLGDPKVNPRDVKRELARAIVSLYYNSDQAGEAEKHFDQVFVKKEIPDEMPEYIIKKSTLLLDIMQEAVIVSSKGEGRRMIKQKAVKLNGEVVEDMLLMIEPVQKSMVLKVGKRRFLRIKS